MRQNTVKRGRAEEAPVRTHMWPKIEVAGASASPTGGGPDCCHPVQCSCQKCATFSEIKSAIGRKDDRSGKGCVRGSGRAFTLGFVLSSMLAGVLDGLVASICSRASIASVSCRGEYWPRGKGRRTEALVRVEIRVWLGFWKYVRDTERSHRMHIGSTGVGITHQSGMLTSAH